MKFLADESCAGPVIRALRDAGHDVTAIAEIAQGAADDVVMARALGEQRILITEDSDFGELVYAGGHSSAGVMLLRFPNRVRQSKPTSVVEAVAKLGARLMDSFTVVEPGRLRIATRPPG
jgi:predicted nuclease of predicted toxin-antitoxin system